MSMHFSRRSKQEAVADKPELSPGPSGKTAAHLMVSGLKAK
jgi:hypothetical protein